MEKEGAAEKVVSKVKEVAEDAKDAVEGAVEGIKTCWVATINKAKKLLYLFSNISQKSLSQDDSQKTKS